MNLNDAWEVFVNGKFSSRCSEDVESLVCRLKKAGLRDESIELVVKNREEMIRENLTVMDIEIKVDRQVARFQDKDLPIILKFFKGSGREVALATILIVAIGFCYHFDIKNRQIYQGYFTILSATTIVAMLLGLHSMRFALVFRSLIYLLAIQLTINL
ncbi:hypothetical protein [Halobacteriovorax sp. ZH2_bin.1]|uniref:hypothetical protein n=1 Tax=unclassified Halobacteriovorax TaxID=2639665 RepID=UPI003720187A